MKQNKKHPARKGIIILILFLIIVGSYLTILFSNFKPYYKIYCNDIFLGYYGIWKYENKMFIPVNRNNICLLMGIEHCNPGVIYDNVYSQRHKLTRANNIPEKVTQYYSDKRLLDVYRKDYDMVNELIDSFILK